MNVQLGKNGLKEGFFHALKNAFKKHKVVKISLLKSATRDKKEMKEIAEKILFRLGKKFSYNIIGFTICLRKK